MNDPRYLKGLERNLKIVVQVHNALRKDKNVDIEYLIILQNKMREYAKLIREYKASRKKRNKSGSKKRPKRQSRRVFRKIQRAKSKTIKLPLEKQKLEKGKLKLFFFFLKYIWISKLFFFKCSKDSPRKK